VIVPGQGVSTEVCDLQGLAKLNALWDFGDFCRRKEEVWEGDTVDTQI